VGTASEASSALPAAWEDYKVLIAEFEAYDEQLLLSHELLLDEPSAPPDEVPERLADASELLERALVTELGRASDDVAASERLRDFGVAVAALDLRIAADVLRLAISRDEWGELADEAGLDRSDLDALVANAEDGLAEEGDTLRELLNDADGTYGAIPPMAGGQEDPAVSPLKQRVDETVASLIGSAREPVGRFVSALPAAIPGAAHVLHGPTGAVLNSLKSAADKAKRLVRAAIRLAVTGMRKILSAIGLGHDAVFDAIRENVRDHFDEWLRELRADAMELAIGMIVRRDRCDQRVREIIKQTDPELVARPPAALDFSFTDLTTSYAENQKWAGRAGSSVKKLAPIVVVLHPPFGAAGLVVLVLVGSSYTLLGLAGRLDTLCLPLVSGTPGVPSVLRFHVLPAG
jgi:hypothetical protein